MAERAEQPVGADATSPGDTEGSENVTLQQTMATATDEHEESPELPIIDEDGHESGLYHPEGSIGPASLSSFSVGLSVDSDDSDANSSLGDDMQRPSSSVSVSSSVYDFVEEFGRTYHRYKEGKYYLPNDEQEQSRLDLQHELALRLLDGKLYLAPIERPHRVVDLGTGTGIWAIEFAEQHPESDVLGTDFSPIEPEYVPPNCRFEIDDMDDDWVYSHPFDYIHGRYIVGFLNDIRKLIRNIYDNLVPGGYVEIMETLMLMEAIDDSLEGTVLQKWNGLMVGGKSRPRVPPRSAPREIFLLLTLQPRGPKDGQGPPSRRESQALDG